MANLRQQLKTASSSLLQRVGRAGLAFAGPYRSVHGVEASASDYVIAVSGGLFEWRLTFGDGAPEHVEITADDMRPTAKPVHAGVAGGVMEIPDACTSIRVRVLGGRPSSQVILYVRRLNRRALAARVLDLTENRRAILSRWRQEGFVAAARALIAGSRGETVEDYQAWIAANETPEQSPDLIAAWLATLPRQPLLSVVTPVYETPTPFLHDCLESVRAQAYANWEHCLVDDCSPSGRPFAVLETAAQADQRVRVKRRDSNGGIAAATNDAIALARGEWIAFLDHDDTLSADALALAAATIVENPAARILYTDEDKIDETGRRSEPYMKAGWDQTQFATQNYFNHLTLIRRDLLEEAGGLRPAFDGSQDYDLLLRCLARVKPSQIVHIPAAAYHWRFASGGRNFSVRQAQKTQERMREAYAASAAAGATLQPAPDALPYPRLRPPQPDPAPLVSIIIPTRDGAFLLERCVRTLKEKSGWARVEFIVMDNDSAAPDALALFTTLEREGVRIARFPGPFNFSAINNAGARLARGDILAFINNDVEAKSADWLLEMVRWFSDPGVAAVGAKLLYPDGRIQHAGIVTGVAGSAGHLYKYREGVDAGPFGRLARAREVSALTAACLLVRASAFRAADGFDEKAFPVAFNDVDLCLRLREGGGRLIWTPDAVLIHHESATRGDDNADSERRERFAAERAALQQRWATRLAEDPYYSPNLTLADESGGLAWPPRYRRPWVR